MRSRGESEECGVFWHGCIFGMAYHVQVSTARLMLAGLVDSRECHCVGHGFGASTMIPNYRASCDGCLCIRHYLKMMRNVLSLHLPSFC